MSPLKSQILGFLLATFTAVGCIVYEKLVKNFSIVGIGMVKILETLVFLLLAYIFSPKKSLPTDIAVLTNNSKLWYLIIF